jgi:tRNA threonylcarbamoyladenosine biosynthesis protein TsaB
VILLALDTCDSRGSLAVLRDDEVLKSIAHEGSSDYSSWVLPTADEALRAAGLGIRDVEVFAAATGPGSFTGVRIGLATVKAWSEAYGRGIAGVSRLKAMARQASGAGAYVAAFADAHRDQVFGALFRREGAALTPVESEMLAAPAEFLDWVKQRSANGQVSWISMDPEKVTTEDSWGSRAEAGESVEMSTNVLAPAIGRIGRMRALEGRLTDALGLDAEYLRRPDAEVFWKGGRAVAMEIGKTHAVKSVRRFRPEDVDAVAAIGKDAPEAATWSRESYSKFAVENGSLALVLETNGRISGFLLGRRVGDQAEVLNLAVGSSDRRKGEGTALLVAAFVEFALRSVGSVYLEVRESNTGAIAFYEKHGFAKTGLRRGYYREPDEGAVTMGKKLTG